MLELVAPRFQLFVFDFLKEAFFFVQGVHSAVCKADVFWIIDESAFPK